MFKLVKKRGPQQKQMNQFTWGAAAPQTLRGLTQLPARKFRFPKKIRFGALNVVHVRFFTHRNLPKTSGNHFLKFTQIRK